MRGGAGGGVNMYDVSLEFRAFGPGCVLALVAHQSNAEKVARGKFVDGESPTGDVATVANDS